MTIDRTALRRLSEAEPDDERQCAKCRATMSLGPETEPSALCHRCVYEVAETIPRVLDEMERLERLQFQEAATTLALSESNQAKDRRIAELESDLLAATEQADSWRTQAQELALRVQVATDLNVGDRKRIAELEALNAAAARAVDVMDDIGEQARARIAALETALTDAINWIADRSSPDSILVDRLRKLVPLEET